MKLSNEMCPYTGAVVNWSVLTIFQNVDSLNEFRNNI